MGVLKKKTNGYFNALKAYQTAVNESSIVSITDLEGKIIYANDKFVQVSHYQTDELIGNTHRLINSGHHPPEFFANLWKTIRAGKPWRGEIKNKAKDGTYYWVDTVIAPVLDRQNRVFQYLSIRNIITTQKENEKALIKSRQQLLKREQQLKDAQHVAKTGSWNLDLEHNSLEWSEETYKIFEIPFGSPMTYEGFLEKVHPGDRERVNENWYKALQGAHYDVEHRIITPSGEKWVRERARLEFDEMHNLKAGVGTTQDITEKKQTEDILKESESLYRHLFNNSPFPKAIACKNNLRFLEVNETAIKVYGYTREEFLKMTGFDIRVPEEHEQMRQLIKDISYSKGVRTHRKKNGDTMKVEGFLTEIIYKNEPCYLITIHDVTEQLKLQDELLQEKLIRQREINRASIEAQEKNRAEIGRELHDNINQLLAASNMYLRSIHPVTENEEASLQKSQELILEAIREIRALSHSLVPPSMNELSLEEIIKDFSFPPGVIQVPVEFNIDINEKNLSKDLKLTIYRIIQEQFNNIIKYAEATKIIINIRQDDGWLYLEIIDNGKGFDQNQKQKVKGIGLTNIIHRTESYNGKATVISSPGNGCKLNIQFPL